MANEHENEPEHPVETDPTGRFTRFRSVLGRGAYKTVYRAFDTDEALEVAWNKLHVERLSKHDLEKVSNEVELLKRVHHNNIIRFYHTWTNPTGNGAQTIDFITEQMTSGTLKDYLKKAKAIKLKVIRRWCSNILGAIAYLHAQKPPIMHRDLKCENIFINGHVGEVKIGDLGLSGVKVRNKADSVIGTPEFMAPELYEEGYTEKVDIYAFGMCLLEMVVMEYPYSECTNLHQIFKKVCNNEKPDAFYRIVECDVKNVIAACLRREDSRPSAAELLEHPLFRDWQQDDGSQSNLSLLSSSGGGYRTRAANIRAANGKAGNSANVIDWSDQLDRTVLVSMPDGEAGNEAEQGADVSVVASQANDNGGFTVALEIPFGDKIKRVKFTFDPFKDSSRHIAQEMVNEFNLAASQLLVIEEEIERQVLTAREQRKAVSRNATPQPVPRGEGGVSSSVVSRDATVHGLQQVQQLQPIEGLRTPDVPEQMHLAPSEPKTPIALNVVGPSAGERERVVESYPTNDPRLVQHVQTMLPPVQAPDVGNPHMEASAQVYHQELQQSHTPDVLAPAQAPLHPDPTPSAIPPSSTPDSGYYKGPSVDLDQSSQMHTRENGSVEQVDSRMPEQVALASVQLDAPVVPGDIPAHHNGVAHVPSQLVTPGAEPLPYSHSAAVQQVPPSQDFGKRGGVENGAVLESAGVPSVSAQLPPANTIPSQAPATYDVGKAGQQTAEYLTRQSPPRAAPPLTYAEPMSQGPAHLENPVQPLVSETRSHSTRPALYNVLPPISSAPMPAVHSELERAIPPAIPQSVSEQQIRASEEAVSINSPHRSISAPVGKIAIDEQAEFAVRGHGVSPMPSDIAPILIPQIQTIVAGESKNRIPTIPDKHVASAAGSASVQSSRPPSIVVVGGERRGSTREQRHSSVPSLSAKSLPEYSRSEAAKVPRSTSLMANVSEANWHPPSDKDTGTISGSGGIASAAMVPGIRSAIGRRSNSQRSSQSDASASDTTLRASTSDSLLGTSINMKDLAASLELMEHCSKGRYASVLQKLDQGTSAKFIDYDRRTPLHIASSRGHIDICRVLLERGADVGARDRWGRSPVSDAKSNHHEAVVDLLKQHGGADDVDLSEKAVSLKMLQYAAKGNRVAVRDCLVAGANAAFADYDKRTALHLACAEGHSDVCELLLVNNADPGVEDAFGRTPVDDAVMHGFRNCLRVLRQYGAEIPRHLMGAHSEAQHQLGLDLIENAAKGRVNAVTKCLHNGANPNFQDYDQRSALHLAAVEGHIDVVEVLLLAGSNLRLEDRWGSTPREEARKADQTAVLDELDNWEKRMAEKRASARNDAPSNGGRRSQSSRALDSLGGRATEGLRPASAASASMSSLAMHADMFLEKYPVAAPTKAVVETQSAHPANNAGPENPHSQVLKLPPVQTSANFEHMPDGSAEGMDEEELMLQAEYTEKLRKLRESRSLSQNHSRRTPVEEQNNSTLSWRNRTPHPPGVSSSAVPFVIPRGINSMEAHGPIPMPQDNLKDEMTSSDHLVQGVPEKAEELASEIVDNIIDVVVQDSNESDGAVL